MLRLAGLEIALEEVPASTWVRASTPPRWAVLESTPLASGEPMRTWTEALADDGPFLRRHAAAEAARLAPASGPAR